MENRVSRYSTRVQGGRGGGGKNQHKQLCLKMSQ